MDAAVFLEWSPSMFKRLIPLLALAIPLSGCLSLPSDKDQKPASSTPPKNNSMTVVEPIADNSPLPEEEINNLQSYINKVSSATRPVVKPQTQPKPSSFNPDANSPALYQPDPVDVSMPDLTWLSAPKPLKLGPDQQSITYKAPHPETQPSPMVVFPEGSMEAHLSKLATDNPRDFLTQLDYQMLLLVSNKTAPRLESLSGLSSEDREMLASVVDAISNMRANARSQANMLAEQKARPLLELADRIRSQAQLRVGTMSLCSRVDGFGVYSALTTRVPVGKDHNVVLYCEVENFLPRQNEAGQWETNLTQETSIYNDKGQRVVSLKPQTCKDLCKNRRHDFFVGQQVTIPGTLPAGPYFLRVSIFDQNANRFCESTLPISIGSDK